MTELDTEIIMAKTSLEVNEHRLAIVNTIHDSLLPHNELFEVAMNVENIPEVKLINNAIAALEKLAAEYENISSDINAEITKLENKKPSYQDLEKRLADLRKRVNGR